MDVLIVVVLGLVGLIAGAASGLFGVGGGIIVVPALMVLVPLSFTDAVAASLVFIVFTSPLGVLRHWSHRNVDFRTGVLLGLSGIAGVLLGEIIQRRVEERYLILGFALLILWSAQHLAYGRLPERSRPSLLVLAGVGVFAGLAAKLFGIGGGIVVVPALVFFGLTVHRAVGTSLVSVCFNAIVASTINLSQGSEWVVWAIPPGVGALLGVQLGVRAAVRLNARALQNAFAIVLMIIAIELVRRGF